MDKYRITLSDGTHWTYAPRSETDTGPWSVDDGWRFAAVICITTADYRAAAEVMERWERDHAPKRRRRVVRVGDRYYARHETLNGWVWACSAFDARGFAKGQLTCDHVLATNEVLDALLSLRDQPDEEYTDDE